MKLRKISSFNLHDALNGEMFGIIFKSGNIYSARLALTDLKSENGPILAVAACLGDESEDLLMASRDGRKIYDGNHFLDAELCMTSVDHEFKPFDRVLARNSGGSWHADIYSHYDETYRSHVCRDIHYKFCIPYEGNEHLIGHYEEN